MLKKQWDFIRLQHALCQKIHLCGECSFPGTKISYKTTDPKHGFDCVKSVIIQHPHRLAAWNCYNKITSRLGKNYSRHAKFLRIMRSKHDDCVSPIVIYGHQFTLASHHQDAAREYLAAYKLLPEKSSN